MDPKTLNDIPPWEWPEGVGEAFLGILGDDQADESDRLLTAELAGGFTVINDELAEALLTIVRSGGETDELRGMASISLGPALEHASTMGFEDADDMLLSEEVFLEIQQSLQELFLKADVPEGVRRRILETSVGAPQDWHRDAIREAYSSDDEAWRLTAVFCMQFVRGFDDQILEALDSDAADIHYQAVCAAGSWEVDAAWPHIAALVTSDETDKALLLAAIEAVERRHQGSSAISLTPTTRTSSRRPLKPWRWQRGPRKTKMRKNLTTNISDEAAAHGTSIECPRRSRTLQQAVRQGTPGCRSVHRGKGPPRREEEGSEARGEAAGLAGREGRRKEAELRFSPLPRGLLIVYVPGHRRKGGYHATRANAGGAGAGRRAVLRSGL